MKRIMFAMVVFCLFCGNVSATSKSLSNVTIGGGIQVWGANWGEPAARGVVTLNFFNPYVYISPNDIAFESFVALANTALAKGLHVDIWYDDDVSKSIIIGGATYFALQYISVHPL